MEEAEIPQAKNASKPERLILKNLVKRFGGERRGGVLAVDDVSLTIAPGSFVTLLGPSGCGKTTTLRLIAGFESPTSGHIFLGDRRMDDVPPNRRDMALVFQSYALFPHMSVFENIAYGLRVRGVTEAMIKNNVEMALHLMNLVGVEDRYPNQLSGGQQQRVALVRALVVHPKVLLFDEPLSNLDAKLRVQMRDEIRRLQRRLGITSVYVTHDQAEAMTLSDTIVVMHDGRVEQAGTPEEIYNRPSTVFVADFIGEANFIENRVQAADADGLTVDLWGVPIRVHTHDRSNGFSVGDQVFLVIRPEAVRLVEDLSGLVGEVRKATYIGSAMHYVVETNDQLISVADTSPLRARVYDEGTSVGVRFFDECFHVLRRK